MIKKKYSIMSEKGTGNKKVFKIYLNGVESKILDTILLPDGTIRKLETDRLISIPSKKNQKTPLISKSTGKLFIKHSEQFLSWQKKTKGFWREQYFKMHEQGIRLPVVRFKVKALFYFGDDKIRDSQNKWETIADALVEHGIIADDDIRVIAETTLRGYVNKNRPRSEIYLTILDPSDDDYEYDLTDYEKLKQYKSQKLKDRYEFMKLKKQIQASQG